MKEKIWKGCMLQMIMAALAGTMFYSYNPVGISFFSALQMTPGMGALAWPVAAAGMYASKNWLYAVKGSIICAVIWCMIQIVEKATNRHENKYITAVIAGIVTMGVEYAGLAMERTAAWFPENLPRWEQWLIPLVLGLLTFCLTVIFRVAVSVFWSDEKQRIFGNEETISVGLVVGLLVYRFGSIDLWGFSPMEAFVYFVIAFIAYKYGAAIGGLVGCGCGIVVTALTNNIAFLGLLSLMGILAGSFRQLSRIGTMLGLGAAVVLGGMLYEPELFSRVWIQGLAIGLGAFAFMPPKLLYRISVDMQPVYMTAASVETKEYRLGQAAESFLHLSKSFLQFPVKKPGLTYEEVGSMVDEVSEKYCRNCIRWDICWNKGKYEAYKETSELFRIAGERGTVFLTDVPQGFANRCRNVHGLVAEINHLMERSRMNLLWHNRLVDSKMAVAAQLQEVSGILSDFSKGEDAMTRISQEQEDLIRLQMKGKKLLLERMQVMETRNGRVEVSLVTKAMRGACVPVRELELILESVLEKCLRLSGNHKIMIGAELVNIHFVEDVNYKILFGTAKKAKGKEEISGDNFGFTQLNCGQTLMTISDGMGHGQKAYTESETIIELLEQMLESGFREEVALKLVNLMLMVNSDAGNTATVDMGVIDQYTGICDFIKMGAAPTFIRHNGWVEMLKSTSLPMGVLESVDYERITKKLSDGDMVIMVSDGVVEAVQGENKEAVLCEMIQQIDEVNPKEFAACLMHMVEQETAEDDMTILTGAVWSNMPGDF